MLAKFQVQPLMGNICLVDYAGEDRHGYVAGSRVPPGDAAYSPYLDIGYNHVRHAWRDSTPHAHTSSEEYFFVLDGRLDFLVNNRNYLVTPRQLIGVRAGAAHQITGGSPPVENFLIRVPGGGNDKIFPPFADLQQRNPGVNPSETILLNMDQSFNEYPLGGCLPDNHANYSPLLDLTCAWGVDPAFAWRDDQRHFHTLREEYYILLRGRLDFSINGSAMSVHAGQILGLKPQTIHQVTGGAGPVDILFVRVPGGRGDKIVTGGA